MELLWVVLALIAWIALSLALAKVIGRVVRRADEDEKLYGSATAPTQDDSVDRARQLDEPF